MKVKCTNCGEINKGINFRIHVSSTQVYYNHSCAKCHFDEIFLSKLFEPAPENYEEEEGKWGKSIEINI